MTNKLISEAPGIVRCTYEEQYNCTKHEWTTFFCYKEESAKMRAAIDEFLEFVRDNQITKHIVDVKACTDTFTEDDMTWLNEYVVPKEIEYGLKYLANVVSDDMYTQLATESWQEEVKGGLVVRNFASEKDAVEWLEQL